MITEWSRQQKSSSDLTSKSREKHDKAFTRQQTALRNLRFEHTVKEGISAKIIGKDVSKQEFQEGM